MPEMVLLARPDWYRSSQGCVAPMRTALAIETDSFPAGV
jgi:hypothetical protein